MSNSNARHGTIARYRGGCRETCCKRAAARYEQERQLERLRGQATRYAPSIGTARRLRALAVMGWTCDALAPLLGVPPTLVHSWRRQKSPLVYLSTHRRVAKLYDRICMTPGASNSAKIRALNHGWAPPLAWDDDQIDDPAAKPATLAFPGVKAIHIDEIEMLAMSGQSWAAIEVRTGFVKNSIQMRLARADRRDITRRISRNSEGEARIADRRNQWSA